MSQTKESFVDYDGFVEKFKPKKTTDDCYTPQNIYDAVADYVVEKFSLDREKFVRPFWPGGDYQNFDYPEDCIVVDNPPFSILKKIITFYEERRQPFFLFAPALTLCNLSYKTDNVTIYPVGVSITYANGATVSTSFVSNLDHEYIMETLPALYRILEAVDDKNRKETTAQLPKYIYPDCVISAAYAQKYSKYGVDYKVRRKDAYFTRALDSQKGQKKGIFGGGLLLSERAAAERAAAERAAAIIWPLSDRERDIIARLGQ